MSSLSSTAAGRIPGSPKSDHSLKGPTRPPKLHRKTDLGRAQVLAALGAHGRRAVLNGAGAPHVADAGGAAVAQLPLLGVQLDLGHLLGCQACGLHLCHQSCVGDDWLSGPCISGCSWYLVHNPGANPWTVRRRELGPSAAADSANLAAGRHAVQRGVVSMVPLCCARDVCTHGRCGLAVWHVGTQQVDPLSACLSDTAQEHLRRLHMVISHHITCPGQSSRICNAWHCHMPRSAPPQQLIGLTSMSTQLHITQPYPVKQLIITHTPGPPTP